jgi:hypothetical protein
MYSAQKQINKVAETNLFLSDASLLMGIRSRQDRLKASPIIYFVAFDTSTIDLPCLQGSHSFIKYIFIHHKEDYFLVADYLR